MNTKPRQFSSKLGGKLGKAVRKFFGGIDWLRDLIGTKKQRTSRKDVIDITPHTLRALYISLANHTFSIPPRVPVLTWVKNALHGFSEGGLGAVQHYVLRSLSDPPLALVGLSSFRDWGPDQPKKPPRAVRQEGKEQDEEMEMVEQLDDLIDQGVDLPPQTSDRILELLKYIEQADGKVVINKDLEVKGTVQGNKFISQRPRRKARNK